MFRPVRHLFLLQRVSCRTSGRMAIPPYLLRGMAQNSSLAGDQQEAARHTVEIDEKRTEDRSKTLTGSTSSAPRPSKPALRRLVDFYDPAVKGPDARNRTLDQILAWPDRRLELSHDFIQILFPLPEGSIFNDLAPVVDEETFLYFRQSNSLKDNLRRAMQRMLAFYGFNIRQDRQGGHIRVTIVEAEDYDGDCFERWVTYMDHNHLRITRILRSLRVLGLADEAQAFHSALVAVSDRYRAIGKSTLGYWERAVNLPLHEAPGGEEVEWLEKYEKENEEPALDSKQDTSNNPEAEQEQT